MKQITSTLLLVRPLNIRSNELTVTTNFFQKSCKNMDLELIQSNALKEFDLLVGKLRAYGVEVLVFTDNNLSGSPDAHFPNNWISFHENGSVVIYPMMAENRRKERNEEILNQIEEAGYIIEDIIDYTSAEKAGIYLEGTGSMVLDRVNRKAYCALSMRTNEDLVIEFCEDLEYTPVLFEANQTVNGKRLPIYHTNVMLCVSDNCTVICLEAIDDKKQRKNVLKHLRGDGKEIIAISEKQVDQFAGNMLQVKGSGLKNIFVMSQSAYDSLNNSQIKTLEKYGTILATSLTTIEACGGGSARCMLAEIFLQKRT